MPMKMSQKTQKQYFTINGNILFKDVPVFLTYEDHRMAMAFAPLAMLHPIHIEDPSVVSKSYPQFWEDLRKLGFIVEEV
jgi:3-phosphoshikimate 1-carboxyvinyltransferase